MSSAVQGGVTAKSLPSLHSDPLEPLRPHTAGRAEQDNLHAARYAFGPAATRGGIGDLSRHRPTLEIVQVDRT
jgi:hypothetical protein